MEPLQLCSFFNVAAEGSTQRGEGVGDRDRERDEVGWRKRERERCRLSSFSFEPKLWWLSGQHLLGSHKLLLKKIREPVLICHHHFIIF